MSARPLVAGRVARSPLRAGLTAACAAVFSALLPGGTAAAQLIPIKTVPVAEGDQFGFLPSANLGMAGVSIALDDALLDPFSNPAKAARLHGTHLFGSPSFYSVSSNAGGGRTLPLGGFARRGPSFAGLMLALQEVSAARRDQFAPPIVGGFGFASDVAPQQQFPTTPRTRTNQYAAAILGRALPEAKLSLAASVFWSGLNAVDGVDLLYAGSQSIKQFGQSLDFRVGMQKELAGDQSLEAVVVHNRFAMTHDVTYADMFWDPNLRTMLARPRLEHNPDRTNTWGLHLQYRRPLADSGARIGAILTANRAAHPKIPNYEIMAIPRDPGYSSAFNVGIGLAEARGPLTFGVDAILEPIWSHTWADAESDVPKNGGGTIPAGAKTIENRFRFLNGVLRAGLSRDFELEMSESSARMQFGVQLRSINYHLDQFSHVLGAGREQDEAWTEWTYTWGTSVRMPDLELHYRLRMTSGTGRPGVAGNGGFVNRPEVDALAGGRNFIVAPSGQLTLDPVHVTTHQISVSLPLR